jgi:beta-glucosidase/6-phospho-beta-glucosidase/beta-galactosidase
MIPAGGATENRLKDFGFVCDDMVERYPAGLGYVLHYLHKKFRLPLYITEHGAASENEKFREADLIGYLKELHAAMEQGVDVRGFFYWSLMDNFEWQFGYSKKFGLIEVDFKDPKMPRKMKPLGEAYRKICQSNLT